MYRTSSNRKPSRLRSSRKQQRVANSFDAIDDAEITPSVKMSSTEPSIRPSTRSKISHNVCRVTQPVRQGAEHAARRGRQGVDAVARRGRQGVEAVARRSRQGVETLRARSKSVPRVRRSTFHVNKLMRDKPLPKSVFGRKKEKSSKCSEDWRNKMPSSTVEKKVDDSFKRMQSSGDRRSEKYEYGETDERNDLTRTRSSGSRRSERHHDEYGESDYIRTRSSGSHRGERGSHEEVD
ncbi:hypothetical protein HJC23_009211 [Cyclotella cryptica]|uniref:Uncharacterized protein n=1 Tax=Cyclotella cryptica TaxID=29204 RepID=A0ABD3P1V1_9STRA